MEDRRCDYHPGVTVGSQGCWVVRASFNPSDVEPGREISNFDCEEKQVGS